MARAFRAMDIPTVVDNVEADSDYLEARVGETLVVGPP